MKRIPTWLIIIIVIGLLIASKFIFFAKKDQAAPAAVKGKNNAPIAVNYYVTETGEFNNDVFATGKIGALNQIEILPEVSGKVTGLYFKEGEAVTKGQLLIKLNDADLQAQLIKIRTQMKLSAQKLE